MGWKDLNPPLHLEEAKNLLMTSLQGMSPIKETKKDSIGWGKNGQYTVKEGYKRLTVEPVASEHIWKKVWHPDSIPKVNSFCWLLIHNKLLTAENLRKRGVAGPSRCALCNNEEETSSHLFMHCSVSLKVWQCVLPSGTIFIPSRSVT